MWVVKHNPDIGGQRLAGVYDDRISAEEHRQRLMQARADEMIRLGGFRTPDDYAGQYTVEEENRPKIRARRS